MPELPEIKILAGQIDQVLSGRRFVGVEVLQPKCLNLPPDLFSDRIVGQQVERAYACGKWVIIVTTDGYLLVNLGMGGEVLLRPGRHDLPEKHRLVLDLDGGECLALNFWWFGYVHFVFDLADHRMTAKLGPNGIDLTGDEFGELLKGRRGGIKSLLLNQSRVAGIGNVTIQDPLFKARVHPLRAINTLSDQEIAVLWQGIQGTLREAIDHGGSAWDDGFFLVAYREGEPCPVRAMTVQKIRTGRTSSYICPTCQLLEGAGKDWPGTRGRRHDSSYVDSVFGYVYPVVSVIRGAGAF